MNSHLQRCGRVGWVGTLNALFQFAFAILAISLFVGNLQVLAADANALAKPTILTNTSYETEYKIVTKTEVETDIKTFYKVFTIYPARTLGVSDIGPITGPPSKENNTITPGSTIKAPGNDSRPVVPSDSPSSPNPLDESTSIVPVDSPSLSSTSTATPPEPTTEAPPQESTSVVPADSPSLTITSTTTKPPSPTKTPPITSPTKGKRQGFWSSLESQGSVNDLSSRLADAAAGKITLTPEDIKAEALREEERRLKRIADEEKRAAAKALAEAKKEQTWQEYMRGEDPFVSRERRVAKAKAEAEEKAAREKAEAERKAAEEQMEADEKAVKEKKEAEEKAASEKAAAESSSSVSSSRSVSSEKSASSKSSDYANSLSKNDALLRSQNEAASSSRSSSSVSSASSASSYTASSYASSISSVLGLPIAEASASATSLKFQIPTDPILKAQIDKALKEFEYKQRAVKAAESTRSAMKVAEEAAKKALEKAEQEKREKEEAEELERVIAENVAKAAQITAEREEKAEREKVATEQLVWDRKKLEDAATKYATEVSNRIAKEVARQKARDDKMEALKQAYEKEERQAAAKRHREEYYKEMYRWLKDFASAWKSNAADLYGKSILQPISWVATRLSTIISVVFSLPSRVLSFLSAVVSYPFYAISGLLSAAVRYPFYAVSGLPSRFLQLFIDLYQNMPSIPSVGNYFTLPAWPLSWPSWSLGSLSGILKLLSNAFGGKPYEGTPFGADTIMPSCGGSVILTILAVASLFVISITTHFIIQYVKLIAPGPFGVVSTILMYQPVFWAIVFSLGYFIPFPFGWLINQLLFQWQYNRFFFFFVILASFKAFKGFVHVFSYYFWTNPAQPPLIPSVTPRDVTVIVATVGDFGPDFQKTVQTILLNQPRQLIIATVGVNKAKTADNAIKDLPRALKGSTLVSVDMTMVPNKRSQFISAASNAEGSIICYADDHVMWPTTFLKSALAPFEDAGVGMVGTVKAVERVRDKGLLVSFLNYIGCIYLERHNFECTATYNIDGGVFVISGRTGLIRKAILERLDFRTGFLNEYFNFGPLNSVLMKPDDDNFMTRYCVKNGWKTVFHNHPDACIGTSIGVDKDGSGSYLNKISGQLARWARTTWRSNLVSLFVDRVCWNQYPWTTYAMFISSFVNLAIIYDPLMLLFLHLSEPQASFVCGAVTLLALSKCVKPLGFIWKHPSDIFWLPVGVLFGYFHSLIRLYALFTVTNVEWSGRVLARPT